MARFLTGLFFVSEHCKMQKSMAECLIHLKQDMSCIPILYIMQAKLLKKSPRGDETTIMNCSKKDVTDGTILADRIYRN